MISIISMLSSPNDESPANIDAAKEWRENPEAFKKRVARVVRKSQVRRAHLRPDWHSRPAKTQLGALANA